MSEKLIMYSLATCPTCVAAREELRAQGTDFEERVVEGNPVWRTEVFRLSGQRTVPVFVLGDEIVVGFHGETG